MTATFTDQAVRDRVTDDLHSTLFVEAGAGTGKTTALVTRVVRLVGSGAARLRELAAITFTEAAAAELRERIGAALEQGAVDPCLAPEVRARLAVALDEVDQTTISTLHGFAQRILSAHAVEAGLPPRLRIHDETASAVAFEERWQRFLDELLGTPEREAVIVQARLCGIGLDALHELARSFDTNWDLVVDHVPPRPRAPRSGPGRRAARPAARRTRRRGPLHPRGRRAAPTPPGPPPVHRRAHQHARRPAVAQPAARRAQARHPTWQQGPLGRRLRRHP